MVGPVTETHSTHQFIERRMRRSLLAVVLVALVLTSGCSFLGGDATPTELDESPMATSTPTTSPTVTPTATPSEYPAGYSDSGVTDAETALSTHVDTLVDRQSFVVDINGSVAAGNGTRALRQLQSIDVDDERGIVAVDSTSDVERVTYFADGKRYLRVDPPGENNTRYNVTNATLEPRGFAGGGFLAPILTNVTFGEANETETENGTFYAYRSTEVDRSVFPTLFGPSVNPENVTRFEAGIVVDESGIVRRASYQAFVDRGDEQLFVRLDLRTYGIDEATISPPTWLDEAEAQS
jgi:hypothetical protein